MKKFETWSKVSNLFEAALVVFWFADLVFTIIGAAKGWSTMTSAERKFAYLNGMVDLLWLFALSIELIFKKAVIKLFESVLRIIDYLEKDAESQSELLKVVNEKIEQAKEIKE